MRWLAIAVAAALLGGCYPTHRVFRSGTQAMVETYLDAAAGGAPDRGWSLLDPSLRLEAFNDDEAAYRRLAEDSDWNQFAWAVTETVPDEPSWQNAYLAVPDGPSSVPQFLLNSNGMGIVDFVGPPTSPQTRARVPVRQNAAGEWWVFAFDVVVVPSYPPVSPDLSP